MIGWGRRRWFGGGVEQHAVQIGGGHAVDHAVVHLGDQRPAVLVDAFDEPVLPQGIIAVQPLRHYSRHQPAEFLLAAGRGQGRLPDVIAEVEVRVVNPYRRAQVERYLAKLPAVERHQRQAPADSG